MKLVPSGNLESADPVLAVRWCLERSEAEQLKKQSAANIYVLFVIAYGDTDLEDRQLVPIDQMMAFLNFRRPGNHTVLAKVVWCAVGNRPDAEMKNVFLEKADHRSYSRNFLNSDRTGFRAGSFPCGDFNLVQALSGDAELEVVVPQEHFPPEPPAWLSRLVNAGFDYPPIDQCSFRRRLLAAPLKLSVFGIWAVITTTIRLIVVAFLLCRGMRDIDFRPLIHPWRDDIEDVWYRLSWHSAWFAYAKTPTGGYRERSRWIYLLYPPIYLALFLLLTWIKIEFHLSYLAIIMAVATALIKAVIAILKFLVHLFSKAWTFALGAAIGFFLLYVLKKANRRAVARKRERESSREFREARRREQEESYTGLYKLLACRPGLVPAVSDLPPEHRTFYLRFLDLKAKVCRPYAAR